MLTDVTLVGELKLPWVSHESDTLTPHRVLQVEQISPTSSVPWLQEADLAVFTLSYLPFSSSPPPIIASVVTLGQPHPHPQPSVQRQNNITIITVILIITTSTTTIIIICIITLLSFLLLFC